jgi:predicted MPP superfamily phosphohydrolase
MSGTPLYFIFRVVFPVLIFGAQWFLYKQAVRFVKSLPSSPSWVAAGLPWVFGFFNFFFLLLLFIHPYSRNFPRWIMYCAVYPIYIWEGATFFVFLVLSIIRILRLPFEAVFHIGKRISPINQKIIVMKSTTNFERFDDSRRTFLKTGAIALSAFSFAGATKGLIDRNDYDIIERTVRIQNLPDEFKGFTIGLMSDIHSSVFMTKPEMDDYVAALNNLKTDIIFVPGDFVNSQTEEVYPFVEAFSSLRAPYGVYGCLGNHDYYADVDVVAKEVDGCGIKLLRNDAVKILKGNSFINLVGVDDIPINGKSEPYLERALSSVQNSNSRILLCHKPYYLETFASHNIDLTLAGHTHGGQIVFAKVGNLIVCPAALFSKYVWGLYKFGNSQMYVTRGIGTVGVPFRINCPPEITKITLQ